MNKIKKIKLNTELYDLDVMKDWQENDPNQVSYIANRTHYDKGTCTIDLTTGILIDDMDQPYHLVDDSQIIIFGEPLEDKRHNGEYTLKWAAGTYTYTDQSGKKEVITLSEASDTLVFSFGNYFLYCDGVDPSYYVAELGSTITYLGEGTLEFNGLIKLDAKYIPIDDATIKIKEGKLEAQLIDLTPGLTGVSYNTPTSTAGCRGFYIRHISSNAKAILVYTQTSKFLESELESNPFNCSLLTEASDYIPTFDELTGLEAGDLVTIINGYHYPHCAKITSVQGNIINFEEALPFTDILIYDPSSGDRKRVWESDQILIIPAKPHIGFNLKYVEDDQEWAFGGGATAFGSKNKASAENSFASGYNNTVVDSNGAVFGTNNIAGFANIVGGGWNTSTGEHSLVVGRELTNTGSFNILGGRRNTNSGGGNLISGYNNQVTGDFQAVFGGMGGSDPVPNKVAGANNIVAGRYLDVSGTYNAVFGTNHIVSGQSTITAGNKNTLTGISTAAFGADNNDNGKRYALLAGRGLTAGGYYQIVTGKYNTAVDGAAIVVGNGSEGDPKNTFTVSLGGDINQVGAITASGKIKTTKNLETGTGIKAGAEIIAENFIRSKTNLQAYKNLLVGQTALTENAKNNVVLVGSNLIASNGNQVIIGSYNDTTQTDVTFAVAGGSSSEGKNVFSITTSGGMEAASSTINGPSTVVGTATFNDTVTIEKKLTSKSDVQFTSRLIVGGEGTKSTGTYVASIGAANNPNNQKSSMLVGAHLTNTSWYQTVLGKYNNPSGANSRPFVIGWGDDSTPKDIFEVASSGDVHAAGAITADGNVRATHLIAKNNFITNAPGITGHQFVNVSNPTNNYINVGAYVEAETGYRNLNFVQGQTAGGTDEFETPGIFGSYNAVFGQLITRDASAMPNWVAPEAGTLGHIDTPIWPQVGETIYLKDNETGNVTQIKVTAEYLAGLNETELSANKIHGLWYVTPEGSTRVQNNITGDFNVVSGDLNGTVIEGHWNCVLGSGGNNKLFATTELIDDGSGQRYINDPARHNLVVGSSNILTGTENALVVGTCNTIGNYGRAHALGSNLVPTRTDSLIVGTYNAWGTEENPRTNIVFGVGIGDNEQSRANGLTVWKQGTVSAGHDPVAPMDLTTKRYVDSKLEDIHISCNCAPIVNENIKNLFNYPLLPEYSLTLRLDGTTILQNSGAVADTNTHVYLELYRADLDADLTLAESFKPVQEPIVYSYGSEGISGSVSYDFGDITKLPAGYYKATANISAYGRNIAGEHNTLIESQIIVSDISKWQPGVLKYEATGAFDEGTATITWTAETLRPDSIKVYLIKSTEWQQWQSQIHDNGSLPAPTFEKLLWSGAWEGQPLNIAYSYSPDTYYYGQDEEHFTYRLAVVAYIDGIGKLIGDDGNDYIDAYYLDSGTYISSSDAGITPNINLQYIQYTEPEFELTLYSNGEYTLSKTSGNSPSDPYEVAQIYRYHKSGVNDSYTNYQLTTLYPPVTTHTVTIASGYTFVRAIIETVVDSLGTVKTVTVDSNIIYKEAPEVDDGELCPSCDSANTVFCSNYWHCNSCGHDFNNGAPIDYYYCPVCNAPYASESDALSCTDTDNCPGNNPGYGHVCSICNGDHYEEDCPYSHFQVCEGCGGLYEVSCCYQSNCTRCSAVTWHYSDGKCHSCNNY